MEHSKVGGRLRGERKLLDEKWCFESTGEKWVDRMSNSHLPHCIYCQGALEHPSVTVKLIEWAACVEVNQCVTRHAAHFAYLLYNPCTDSCCYIYVTMPVWGYWRKKKLIVTFDIFFWKGVIHYWPRHWQTHVFKDKIKNQHTLSETALKLFTFPDRPDRHILYLKCVL